jgi:hypothetical protein
MNAGRNTVMNSEDRQGPEYRDAQNTPKHESEEAGRTPSGLPAGIGDDSVCRKILEFLLTHESAMDTVKGIALHWVGKDEVAVQGALDQLGAHGLIITHTRRAGTFYALTPSPGLRAWLREILSVPRPAA